MASIYQTVYRIQPKNKALPKYSVTSNGNRLAGCFVFTARPSEKGLKANWLEEYYKGRELVIIRCKKANLYDPGDYEGEILNPCEGRILKRIPWDKKTQWFKEREV